MAFDKNTLYRCFYCNKLIWRQDLDEDGACECGSRKTRIAFAVTDEEMAELETRGFVRTDEQFTTVREEAWKSED